MAFPLKRRSTLQQVNRHAAQCLSHKASCITRLHSLEDLLLEVTRTLNLLASVIGGGLAVEREEVTKIELWCLEELDLADVDLFSMLVCVCPCFSRSSHMCVLTFCSG